MGPRQSKVIYPNFRTTPSVGENGLDGGGGDGHDGGMESRIARLEAAAEYTGKRLDGIDGRLGRIDGDLRILLGAMIGGFLILSAALATGYLRVDDRFSRLDSKISAIEVGSAKIDSKLDAILGRLPPQHR